MSTIGDKIQSLSERIGPLKDKLKGQMAQAEELQKKLEADSDDETLPEMLAAVSEEIDTTRKAVETLDRQRDDLKKFEQTMAGGSQPAAKSATPIRKRSNSDDEEPGRLFAKMSLAEGIAKIKGIPAPSVVEELYGDDDRVKAARAFLTKTAVAPADTTTTGWAAELVRNEVRGFLDTLKTRSVGAAVAARSMQLDFGGAASVTVPRRNQLPATQTEPAWVN